MKLLILIQLPKKKKRHMTSGVVHEQTGWPLGTPAHPTPVHANPSFPSATRPPPPHPPPINIQTDIKTKPDPGPGICKVLPPSSCVCGCAIFVFACAWVGSVLH